jgi:flagellar basal-body rod protein FlgB
MGFFDNAFGIHETSLVLRGQRASVLAANIANADTPNYKARDLDFQAVLNGELDAVGLPLARTTGAHLGAEAGVIEGALKYRNPWQRSLDGNTVEAQVEHAAFGENAVRYQASLMFINRRIATIELALSGQ